VAARILATHYNNNPTSDFGRYTRKKLQHLLQQELALVRVWPLSRDSMALLQASKLAHGALGVAPAAYHLLQSLKGYASTTTGAAAAAAQPLTVDEATEPADSRWRRELGVIRTDWT